MLLHPAIHRTAPNKQKDPARNVNHTKAELQKSVNKDLDLPGHGVGSKQQDFQINKYAYVCVCMCVCIYVNMDIGMHTCLLAFARISWKHKKLGTIPRGKLVVKGHS